MWPRITTKTGLAVCLIVWLALVWYMLSSLDCAKFDGCTADDVFLMMILGVGMIVPAWFAGSLISMAQEANDPAPPKNYGNKKKDGPKDKDNDSG